MSVRKRVCPQIAAGLVAVAALVAVVLLSMSPARALSLPPSGRVIAIGAAALRGEPGVTTAPVVGLAATPKGDGYWVVTASGAVRAYGAARPLAKSGRPRLNRPVTDIAVTPTGRGYWLVTEDGAVLPYGDAVRAGSVARPAPHSIVGMAATPTGRGYWLAAADGGVFSFGDARFRGSAGTRRLNSPIVGIAARPKGDGYWLASADGGIFSFGAAAFAGSDGAKPIPAPVVAVEADRSGKGYWLARADGAVDAFGAARRHGSASAVGPVADLAARPQGDGYWLVTGGKRPAAGGRTTALAAYRVASLDLGPSDESFDRLARCESNGRWNLSTGNGYYGGLQFNVTTWRANGGAGYPHLATRLEQIEVARRVWSRRGWVPWPSCSRSLGLR